MNPETIKELILAFQQLGGDAKEAFVWYLLASYGTQFLSFVIGMLVVLVVARWALRFFVHFTAGDTLRRAAGVRVGWTDSELEEACQVLREHCKDF